VYIAPKLSHMPPEWTWLGLRPRMYAGSVCDDGAGVHLKPQSKPASRTLACSQAAVRTRVCRFNGKLGYNY